MTSNAYDKYQENKILTASKQELTLMLYEGMIKFCNLAIMALEKKDYEETSKNIIKIENIILELQATLNKSYSVWESFNILYMYIYDRLIEANLKKDMQLLNEVILPELRSLRDVWKEVMVRAKQGQPSQVKAGTAQ